jgi:hypothetical protein
MYSGLRRQGKEVGMVRVASGAAGDSKYFKGSNQAIGFVRAFWGADLDRDGKMKSTRATGYRVYLGRGGALFTGAYTQKG